MEGNRRNKNSGYLRVRIRKVEDNFGATLITEHVYTC